MAAPVVLGGLLSGAIAGVTAFAVVLGSGGNAPAGPGLALDASAVPDQAYVTWLDQAGALCPQVSAALLAAQIDQESGWDPTAVSSAGAEGISQFMPGTWPSWDQPPAVPGPDTPFVPADAIMAQGRYDCALAQAVAGVASENDDDITSLMLAAYNAGPAAVIAADGIPDIPQTEAYVSAVLADLSIYAEQLSNPAGSGFAQAEITAAESWLGTSGLKNPPWSRRAYVVHREVSGAPGCGRSIGKSPARPARDSSIAAITPIQPSCVRLPTAPAGGAGRSDVSDHILGCTCAQCVPLRSTARPST